LKISTILT